MHMLQLRRRRRRRLFLCVVEVAYLVSNLFFTHAICNTKCFCIQKIDPHLTNTTIVFLTWLIVVLLLLQTMRHCHRVVLAFFLERKNSGVKCALLSALHDAPW